MEEDLKPKISIVLPTRGRPQGLVESLKSILSKAKFPHLIELLIKVDDDDLETLDAVQGMSEYLVSLKTKSRIFVLPRNDGYWNIHDWLNQMCREASGEWIFNWSDDVLMETDEWDVGVISTSGEDRKLIGMEDGVCVLVPLNSDSGRRNLHEFFILRKEVFDILGHLSLSPHADTWVCNVMRGAERFFLVRIYIKHDNSEVKDKTSEDGGEVTKISAEAYRHPIMARARLMDSLKLLDHIENFRKPKEEKTPALEIIL